MHCLWCHEEILQEINWINLLSPPKQTRICYRCSEQLIVISGNRCPQCSRLNERGICNDCLRWKELFEGEDVITFNYSVFPYTSFIKEVVAKWKYRGDYELGFIFREKFLQFFKEAFQSVSDPIVVPIPLSKERLFERGFNQTEMLASFLPVETQHVLTRVQGEKQAKKTRVERISSENPFNLKKKLNNSVILVDDIYTTGTTLRHAAKLLRESGCPDVYTYTLVRG
ncbi:ComF family protein [Ornithinibacillus halotolerans]|uniref:Amidophosphoribosyltransferase n=1 Tax=Ornithinibacillus halotolerans TaxID=1274357 RepID=A0A916RRP5_9BACI|nr:ComF family protein [Ornithinibacillus halotolerans]GGA67148.1 amidophosphoribosyltransferase [Ornithinibacillus halotolerans]